MKFSKIPEDTFKQIQLGAGMLLSTFNPANAEVDLANILGATSGGVNFSAVPTFTDFGEDIDGCPKNMKELKKLETWDIKLSGSYVTATAGSIASMLGAADASGNKVTPRSDLLESDFKDIWWVGDYSDENGDDKGGFVAIHMMNALSTGGFQIQSTDKAKGKFNFEYTAHYSIENQTVVPFEVYVQAGVA
jgi:hypothetical protein